MDAAELQFSLGLLDLPLEAHQLAEDRREQYWTLPKFSRMFFLDPFNQGIQFVADLLDLILVDDFRVHETGNQTLHPHPPAGGEAVGL